MNQRFLLLWLFTLVFCSPDQRDAVKSESLTKVLLFKWKPDVTSQRKSEFLRLFRQLSADEFGYYSLEEKTIASDRFEYALFLTFPSTANEQQYTLHPLHQKIIVLGPHLIEDFFEFNYQ